MDTFHFYQGSKPLLVSMPHVGLEIPRKIKEKMTDEALALNDTDWFIDRLYNFLVELDVSVISAKYSRYVVDLNRGRDGLSLYPGQRVTGFCPKMTFDDCALYKDKYEEYPGDSTVKNILLNIFQDDDLCKTRLSSEIKLHQQKMRGEKSDYNKLF